MSDDDNDRPPPVITQAASPLVWVFLGDTGRRFLSCLKCSGGMGTDAYEREFLYVAAGAPRCARCGWGPPEWLEARARQTADERAYRVVLTDAGFAALMPAPGGD